MILFLLIFVALGLLFYYKCFKPTKYWSDRGVPQGKALPIFGNSLQSLLGKKNALEIFDELYKISPNSRYFGIYQMGNPALIIRDPDLIKQVTVKDFDYFVNRKDFVDGDADKFWSKNLFSLKDHPWREMRVTLSPSFTSSKMRMMYNLMGTVAKNVVEYFKEQKGKVIEVKMKEVFTRYANDVIASAAFGISLNSLQDKDNAFYLIGKQLISFGGFWVRAKICLYFLAPKICKIFKISLFDNNTVQYFYSLIEDNIRNREEKGIVRPDMLHILLESRKGNEIEDTKTIETGFATVQEHQHNIFKSKPKLEISNEDIAAQAMVFFFAGFETVSALLSFLSYELAVHPDVQKKLTQEIFSTLEDNDGNISYEVLLKMKYLDMVICETLRRWPTLIVLNRVCTKPYTIEPKTQDEVPVHLNVGDVVMIPMCCLQYDPKYYSDPKKFDPERFSEENARKLNPYVYMPFGLGPRNCIGSRFALLEAKLIMFYLLANFEIVPVKDTTIPLKLSKRSLFLTEENGFPLGLKPRNRK